MCISSDSDQIRKSFNKNVEKGHINFSRVLNTQNEQGKIDNL